MAHARKDPDDEIVALEAAYNKELALYLQAHGEPRRQLEIRRDDSATAARWFTADELQETHDRVVAESFAPEGAERPTLEGPLVRDSAPVGSYMKSGLPLVSLAPAYLGKDGIASAASGVVSTYGRALREWKCCEAAVELCKTTGATGDVLNSLNAQLTKVQSNHELISAQLNSALGGHPDKNIADLSELAGTQQFTRNMLEGYIQSICPGASIPRVKVLCASRGEQTEQEAKESNQNSTSPRKRRRTPDDDAQSDCLNALIAKANATERRQAQKQRVEADVSPLPRASTGCKLGPMTSVTCGGITQAELTPHKDEEDRRMLAECD
jgi:hypothetical protein